MNELEQRLRARLAELDQGLPDAAIGRLLAYIALLVRWNRVFNLTGAGSPRRILDEHVAEALALLPLLNAGPALDVGSGAGFPGLVLACAEPSRPWVLLDSNAKKTRFLRQAVIELGLPRVAIVRQRLEQYRPRQRFALITVRAVGGLPDIWRTVRPWLTDDACLIAFKGELADAELAELTAAGARPQVAAIERPHAAHRRHLVILRSGAGSVVGR